MDYDIGNQAMLQAGASAYIQSLPTRAQGDGWQPIATAPKDGTIIEVRCTYGVAPWYGLFRWTKDITVESQICDNDGKCRRGGRMTFESPGWHKVGDEASGFSEDSSFSWRPYAGNTAQYSDPTGGAQNSAAYWRGAVAAKYGLPLNSFEGETARNVALNSDAPWYTRIYDWLLSW